ncbi:sensor histidine kinase [Mariniflexile sp. AS56]|uniref:sensor histidine kinase n=1 Tax=Mariniflexile sp. AS56 TaxID=3063957 RepID=UPI0026F17852|nr:HAMP domain-containing sensor histidine kinase [Mariniflexile sp. AS56]MDO7170611.1 HAMP domain-containing sensor histidine kinase [Mariniflexile sp. AS56]
MFNRFETSYLGFLLTLVAILVIGVIDFKTGVELSFSFFYIIPIALFSKHRATNKVSIISLALVAACCWFISEYANRDFSMFCFPVWNALVRLFIFLLIGFSLFNLRIKEMKLNGINNDLQLLNNEKNKMIGVAAHDLNNPISAINSFSHLLIHDSENTKKDLIEGLEIIETLSSNTLGVLKNLLSVSTIESGKVVLNIEQHNYVEFVRQQMLFNQILANNKKITISLDAPMETISLGFDANYLSQVMGNLISNAIKYSVQNSHITIRILKSDSNFVRTEIIDNGKGIQEKELEKLFNYFQKTTTQPTDGESSTGLGLAISKKIITLHQGEIGVKSTIDKGSVFYFTLPMGFVMS